jgi:hypothetical protein
MQYDSNGWRNTVNQAAGNHVMICVAIGLRLRWIDNAADSGARPLACKKSFTSRQVSARLPPFRRAPLLDQLLDYGLVRIKL